MSAKPVANASALWAAHPSRLLLLLLLLGGCSFAPDYVRPHTELPAAWDLQANDRPHLQWWRRFKDPALNALVAEALLHNRDIAAALERVEQAAAFAGVSASALAPTPTLSADGSRTWSSRQIANPPPPGGESLLQVNTGFRALWELDLWGKYRNSLYRDEAVLRQTQADRDALCLLVAGNTVKAYAALLGFKAQVGIAENTLRRRRQALRIYRSNVEAGYINQADLFRARGEVETARYRLQIAHMQYDAAESALLLLIGRSPVEIMRRNGLSSQARLADLPVAPAIPDGLPSSLLERRPDLRAAEESLKAANFDIGVIRAEYFPSFSLSGQTGLAVEQPRRLNLGDAVTWMYSGTVNLPLDFWRTRFSERMAEARNRELAANYEKAVQSAFHELRDALVRQHYLGEADKALAALVKSLEQAALQARDRYANGYSSFLEVLDAERSLFDARMLIAQNRHDQITSIVDVHMALGGGWSKGANIARATAPHPEDMPLPAHPPDPPPATGATRESRQ